MAQKLYIAEKGCRSHVRLPLSPPSGLGHTGSISTHALACVSYSFAPFSIYGKLSAGYSSATKITLMY